MRSFFTILGLGAGDPQVPTWRGSRPGYEGGSPRVPPGVPRGAAALSFHDCTFIEGLSTRVSPSPSPILDPKLPLPAREFDSGLLPCMEPLYTRRQQLRATKSTQIQE